MTKYRTIKDTYVYRKDPTASTPEIPIVNPIKKVRKLVRGTIIVVPEEGVIQTGMGMNSMLKQPILYIVGTFGGEPEFIFKSNAVLASKAPDKYRVIKKINFGSGFTHDKTGKAIPLQSLAPKIGDIIELGEPETQTLSHMIKPILTKGYDFISKQAPDLKLFIPASDVEKVSDDTIGGTNKSGKDTEAKSFFTLKNTLIGLGVVVVIVGGLKLLKVF